LRGGGEGQALHYSGRGEPWGKKRERKSGELGGKKQVPLNKEKCMRKGWRLTCTITTKVTPKSEGKKERIEASVKERKLKNYEDLQVL